MPRSRNSCLTSTSLRLTACAAVLVTAAACAGGPAGNPAPGSAAPSAIPPTPTGTAGVPAGGAAARTATDERIAGIEQAVAAWQGAADLGAARRAAEQARNLIVGPAGPYYGDGDGDGLVAGASAAGLLPGLTGGAGIATPADGPCVVRDVLGGSWANPAARWAELDRKIEAWRPGNNQFPTLPSHPQRVVGWATLTLRASSLAEAVDFAGHARIHSDISRQALAACGG